MRDTLLARLQMILEDEVFLMKYSNNSIESLQKLLYVDFKIYGERLLDTLKKESEVTPTSEAIPIGNPNVPIS